jgi:hypothetical protein
MKSSANPLVEPCQEEFTFALTTRVTTTVWDVAPVALIVIVPLYVPAARPDVLKFTWIVSCSPVLDPLAGLQFSQVAI